MWIMIMGKCGWISRYLEGGCVSFLDYHNKSLQTWGMKQQKFILSQPEVWKQVSVAGLAILVPGCGLTTLVTLSILTLASWTQEGWFALSRAHFLPPCHPPPLSVHPSLVSCSLCPGPPGSAWALGPVTRKDATGYYAIWSNEHCRQRALRRKWWP